MKAKTKDKLCKIIGELEMIQCECEKTHELDIYDNIGDCVNTLTEILVKDNE